VSKQSIPHRKAIIVISDGKDEGSVTTLENVALKADGLQVPIHSLGFTRLSSDHIKDLEKLSKKTGALHKFAKSSNEILKKLINIYEYIMGGYRLRWKVEDIKPDGKRHHYDISLDYGGGTVKSRGIFIAPLRKTAIPLWLIMGAAVVVASSLFAVFKLIGKRKTDSIRCPSCNRVMMPDWDVCMFCLQDASALLTITKGKNEGKVFPIVGKKVTIGKGDENAVRIDDPAVSTLHASIELKGDVFELKDMGSKNGTFVNGRRVESRYLGSNDIIAIGETELKFELRRRDKQE
jgi:hypothetical protein